MRGAGPVDQRGSHLKHRSDEFLEFCDEHRTGPLLGVDVAATDAADALYLDECDPIARADIVVDNNDFATPRLVRG